MTVPTGRILRFDAMRGYGFIEPEGGGEDVFLHANDLLDDKHLLRRGTVVQYEVTPGERGLKAAFGVQIVSQPHPPVPLPPRRSASGSRQSSADPDGEEPLCDVLPREEYLREATELLLTVTPPLSAPQILSIREKLAEVAAGYGWLEN